MLIKKKKKTGSEAVLNETIVPAYLPVYGLGLDTFVPGTYHLLDESFPDELSKEIEGELSPVIEITDEHSPASVCDSDIDGKMLYIEAEFEKECVRRTSQCDRIVASRKNRHDGLERDREQAENEIDELEKAISPLKGLYAQHEIKLGRCVIPVGSIVTFIAMLIDGMVNYSYLESILLESIFLLWICVLCLSVMSDGCMWCLGNLVSKKEEDSMSRPLYRALCAGFITMFLLSVAASIMIRFGSMASTFGTINSSGQFIAKDSYSLAEYGVSLVTAFLTTATGLISFYYSVDKNAHLVNRRREMETKLAKSNARLDGILLELASLEYAEDPHMMDLEYRKAAATSLEALRVNLKLYKNRMLIRHQQDASYTDAVSEAGAQLISDQEAAKKWEKSKSRGHGQPRSDVPGSAFMDNAGEEIREVI